MANSKDFLYGGAGNDWYFIDHLVSIPTVTEYASQGNDTIGGMCSAM